MPYDPLAELEALRRALDDAAGRLAWPDARLFAARPEQSAWTPAQHLYHVAVAGGMMLGAVQAIATGTPPARASGGLNAIGQRVLRAEQMPRGRAAAPEATHPPEAPTREALAGALARTRRKLNAVAALVARPGLPGARVPHPYLGQLDAAEWLRVNRIHTRHHLALIDEIAGADA